MIFKSVLIFYVFDAIFLSPLDLKEVVLTDGSGYSSLASLETPARNYPISRYLISSCYFFLGGLTDHMNTIIFSI